jgi:LacI family transcriptional regulator
MADVASAAGVSLGTVSNVLNQPHKVAPRTVQRVQAAIDELRFVPNRAARALAAGTSTTVGFVLTDLSNSFFLDMTRGAEDAGRASSKSLLLANSDLDPAKQDFYLGLFDEERVAGILLTPVARELGDARRVRDHGRPVVVLNEPAATGEFCSVTVDDELGGYLAARHLIDLGRRRLAFVGGPDRLEPVRERRVGAERAVRETDGAVSIEVLPTREVQVEDGREAGAMLARRDRRDLPDGIVAAADLLAMGIVQSLDAEDVRFPDDIAIIGYDNNRAARDTVVPLSTVEQPGPAMGAAAMRLLLDEVENPDHEHSSVVLDPVVIARQSSTGIGRQRR